MNFLRNYFRRPHTDRVFWLGWALVIKGIFFLYLFLRPNSTKIPGFLGSELGDSRWYILPVDNFFDHGHYIPGFRMPGYSALYLPFRWLAGNTGAAANALVILQGVLAAIGLYLLSVLAFRLSGKEAVFRWCFFLFGFSTFANLYDAHLLTESFSTFLLILSAFLFERAVREGGYRLPFLAGLAITWLIFCKPFYAPLLGVAALLIVLPGRSRRGWSFRPAFALLLPFVLFDSLWAFAHYRVHGRAVILQPSQYYPDDPEMLFRNPLLRFVMSWGGNDVAWYPDADINYFWLHNREIMHYEKPALPDDIYTSAFNADTMARIEARITALFKGHYKTAAEHHRQDSLLAADLDRYTLSVKKERPFLYYIKAPLEHLYDYHVHGGSKDLLPKPKTPGGYAFLTIKYGQMGYYAVSILAAIATAIYLLRKKRQVPRAVLFMAGAVLHTWLTPPLFLGYSEIRYLTPAYPLAVLCAAYGLWLAYERKKVRIPA